MTTLLALLALAQDPSARVAELAPELEAAEPSRIYRAVERLAELGPAVAPLLEARAERARGDAKAYLLLAAAEARRSALLPGGGRVRRFSISYAPQDLATLVDDFRRRSGARLLVGPSDPADLPQVRVDLREATFAEALVEIARAGRVAPRRQGEDLLLESCPVEPPSFTYADYLLRLQSFTQRRTIDFRRPARNRIELYLDALWDPHVRVGRSGPAEIREALDDRGRKLVPAAPDPAARAVPMAAPWPPGQDVDGGSTIELEVPGDRVATISLLRGALPVLIVKASVELTLDPPAEGSAARADGFELRVLKHDPARNRLELELSAPGRRPGDWKSMPRSVTACDRSGKGVYLALEEQDGPADVARFTARTYDEDGRRAVLRAGDAPEPRLRKVAVTVATECVERPVPFEFRELKVR